MPRVNIYYKPYKKSKNISFDDLYEDSNWDWQYKSKELQARRWRALKHASKNDRYPAI